MNPYEYIKRIFKAKAAEDGSDFSSFITGIPLTPKQQRIEECKNLDVSIYIDDPSEQSAGVNANLRAVASEAEIERRLNAAKATQLSKWAIIISLLAFIESTIAFVKSFI